MNITEIFQLIELDTDRYISFLAKICSFEARAYDKAEIDRMVDYIEAFTFTEGFTVTRTPFEACGDFLTIDLNPGAEKAGFLLAHLDTVHDKGVFGNPPVRIVDDRMTGPGTVDCKGGVAVARKGILRYQIQIHGKGGHSDFLQEFAHNCIDSGAHAVIGHGPHLLRPLEIYRGCPIFFSLGDFVIHNECIPFAPEEMYHKQGLTSDATMRELFFDRSAGYTRGLMRDRRMLESVSPYFEMTDGKLS